MRIIQPPENTPEEIENHDVLIFAIHYLLMPNQLRDDGSKYATIPSKIKNTLAKITGGCTADYNNNPAEVRLSWWHAHYDNLRFFLGLGGREGGRPTQNRMRIANEFWIENQDIALSYAMTTFYNNDSEELRNFINSEMGLDYDNWREYIMAYGEEFEQNDDGESIHEDISLSIEPKLSNLNDSELAILQEINKFAEKLRGTPNKSMPKKLEKLTNFSRFKIWAGIPGTGKSYNLKQELKNILTDTDIYSVRTVFHPEYSNHDFIGQIKPEAKSDGIDYPFIPGPFTLALEKAYKAIAEAGDEEPETVALVIEELNRGNASAIFGEIFQLLDLDENGQSEYGIDNRDIAKRLGIAKDEKIRIPNNMLIYATMNISDQNVFPLDTAFLRRWDRRYTNATDWTSPASDWIIKLPQGDISWENFAETINGWIVDEADNLGIEHPEDKRLGPWFVEQRHCDNSQLFANKVLVYLWTNVFTHSVSREQTFSIECKTLEDLLNKFLIGGTEVFNTRLSERLAIVKHSLETPTIQSENRENLMANLSETIRRIIDSKPTSLPELSRVRIESVKDLAKDRIAESGGKLGDGYSSHIDSQIRRRFFNATVRPVNLEQFDTMIFDYISGKNNDILEKSSNRNGQEGYSDFKAYLDQGRSDYPAWISASLVGDSSSTEGQETDLFDFSEES